MPDLSELRDFSYSRIVAEDSVCLARWPANGTASNRNWNYRDSVRNIRRHDPSRPGHGSRLHHRIQPDSAKVSEGAAIFDSVRPVKTIARPTEGRDRCPPDTR